MIFRPAEAPPAYYVEKIRAATPLGRIGTPIDVAQVVVFLASNLASFVNGANIHITGGFYGDPNF